LRIAITGLWRNAFREFTLDVGGGSGNLQPFLSDIITNGIRCVVWMDWVADAERLPLKNASLGNARMWS